MEDFIIICDSVIPIFQFISLGVPPTLECVNDHADPFNCCLVNFNYVISHSYCRFAKGGLAKVASFRNHLFWPEGLLYDPRHWSSISSLTPNFFVTRNIFFDFWINETMNVVYFHLFLRKPAQWLKNYNSTKAMFQNPKPSKQIHYLYWKSQRF